MPKTNSGNNSQQADYKRLAQKVDKLKESEAAIENRTKVSEAKLESGQEALEEAIENEQAKENALEREVAVDETIELLLVGGELAAKRADKARQAKLAAKVTDIEEKVARLETQADVESEAKKENEDQTKKAA